MFFYLPHAMLGRGKSHKTGVLISLEEVGVEVLAAVG